MCIGVRWEKLFATFESFTLYVSASTDTSVNVECRFVVRGVSFRVLPVLSMICVVVDSRKRFLFNNFCENKKKKLSTAEANIKLSVDKLLFKFAITFIIHDYKINISFPIIFNRVTGIIILSHSVCNDNKVI